MKYCTNCGKQLVDTAKFCGLCGEKQDEIDVEDVDNPFLLDYHIVDTNKITTATCPYCHNKVLIGATVCRHCKNEISYYLEDESNEDFYIELPLEDDEYEDTDNEIKKCPFCLEIINKGAKTCKYCKSQLNDRNITKNNNSIILIVVSFTMQVFVTVLYIFSDLISISMDLYEYSLLDNGCGIIDLFHLYESFQEVDKLVFSGIDLSPINMLDREILYVCISTGITIFMIVCSILYPLISCLKDISKYGGIKQFHSISTITNVFLIVNMFYLLSFVHGMLEEHVSEIGVLIDVSFSIEALCIIVLSVIQLVLHIFCKNTV